MQFQKKEKRQTTVRFDSHHVRLRTGEVQRKTGSYMYRWTDKLGKRNTIYAATLEDLREQEEQILVDQHDGIKANIKNVTVNDVYELWCQLKRGIKDSTMKNYIYMYELFVKPTFGKKKLVQVKKSDVRRFYNQLIDDKVLKPSTVDVIHNIVHQVFQIAVDDDMIRSNPAANMLREIKMAHGSEIEKRKALTLEQEELFLGYLARTPKYQHWYPVFYIMANTGMRVGEITGLRWCDVDMENGIISVNHTLVYYNHRDEKGCYFSINTPKTKVFHRAVEGAGCIYCEKAFLKELPYLLVTMYAKQYGLATRTDDEKLIGARIDAVIPELRLAFAFSQKGTDREAKVEEVLRFLCKAKRIQLFVIRQKDPIALATEIKQAFAKANLFINSDSQRDVAHLRKRYFAQKNNGN